MPWTCWCIVKLCVRICLFVCLFVKININHSGYGRYYFPPYRVTLDESHRAKLLTTRPIWWNPPRKASKVFVFIKIVLFRLFFLFFKKKSGISRSSIRFQQSQYRCMARVTLAMAHLIKWKWAYIITSNDFWILLLFLKRKRHFFYFFLYSVMLQQCHQGNCHCFFFFRK